ncbi:MAG TPA: hypothetical protein VGI16_10350 [Candidatus Acidoferrum sp.]|jgi:hypothetical protein
MRSLRFILFFLSIAVTADTVHAGELRIALLANATVERDSILLADLLPENVSLALHTASASIRLGSTPQGGSFRTFGREYITNAIQKAGLPTSLFDIPEIVTVRRAGRTVTREEIFAAIQNALSKQSFPAVADLHAADLSWESAVRLPNSDPQLQVTQIKLDTAIGTVRFRMSSRTARGVHPFYVSAQSSGAAPPQLVTTSNTVSFISEKDAYSAAAPILVDPRQYARLHLHSNNSDMILQVKPLERGHLNETIRVRLPASGKTLKARVIAAGYLDATF